MVSEPQELLSGREFKFTYRTKIELVENLTWEHRLDKYGVIRKGLIAQGASNLFNNWMQLVFMLVAVGLSTFALVRSLRLALNRDQVAIEMMPRRRRNYERVHFSEESGIEDAMAERSDTSSRRDLATRKVAWKKIHAQVFRPPKYPMLLALLIGAGV